MKFFIISPGYECEKWLGVHITSVLAQRNLNYHHIIVNSHASKAMVDLIGRIKPRQTAVLAGNSFKILESHIAAMDHAFDALGMSDEDVVVHLDGDDWFYHPYVLDCLEQAYGQGAWATYGNYLATDGTPSLCRPARDKFDRRKDVFYWYFSHLRTFKAFFWKRIKKEDFYFDQEIFPMAADVAICAPVLEMCPLEKLHFLDLTNVIYNRFTPFNNDKISPQAQYLCTVEISKRKPYKEL